MTFAKRSKRSDGYKACCCSERGDQAMSSAKVPRSVGERIGDLALIESHPIS